MEVKDRVLWTQWGEYARSILHQFNAYLATSDYRMWGPHFVTYERGEFRMYPYGTYAEHRYSFECRPEFLPGQEEPLWIFMVRM